VHPTFSVNGVGERVAQELGEVDGAHLRPDRLRPPEVGDAAFGGDAGAGEGHGVAALPEAGGELGDPGFELRVHADTTIAARANGVKPRIAGSRFSFWQTTPAVHKAAGASTIPGKRRAGGSEERADRTSARDERTATEPPF